MPGSVGSFTFRLPGKEIVLSSEPFVCLGRHIRSHIRGIEAPYSYGSEFVSRPGRCTFAHSGSWRAEDFSKSASFEYPPFRNSHLPTRRVVLLSALYSLLPILSIGLIEFLPKKVLRVILLRKMQKDCILVLHFTQNPCILFPAPKLQSGCSLGN